MPAWGNHVSQNISFIMAYGMLPENSTRNGVAIADVPALWLGGCSAFPKGVGRGSVLTNERLMAWTERRTYLGRSLQKNHCFNRNNTVIKFKSRP